MFTDVIFCSCGHIHLIDESAYEKAIQENKEILLICANCGRIYVKGVDVEEDGGYLYSQCLPSDSPQKSKLVDTAKYFSIVLYSEGYRVPMRTGNYATTYFGGLFFDGSLFDFDTIKRRCEVEGCSWEKIYEQMERDSAEVDMPRFLEATPKDALKCISSYHIKAFDWPTEYFDNLEEEEVDGKG